MLYAGSDTMNFKISAQGETLASHVAPSLPPVLVVQLSASTLAWHLTSTAVCAGEIATYPRVKIHKAVEASLLLARGL
jgi:hypothetical protein